MKTRAFNAILSFTIIISAVSSVSCYKKKPPALKTNGCGPAGLGWLVPDKAFALDRDAKLIKECNFHRACDNHDLCYGKCLKGGEYYKKDECGSDESREKIRKDCDRKLREDIRKNNKGKPVCGIYASIYYWAVSKLGEGSFDKKGIGDLIDYSAKNPGNNNLEEIVNDIYELADSKIDFSDRNFVFQVKGSEPQVHLVSRETKHDSLKKQDVTPHNKRVFKYGRIFISNILINGKPLDVNKINELNLDHKKFKKDDAGE